MVLLLHMFITRLELKNFRSVKAVSFDFMPRLNLFVGINGSGKSSILDALSTSLSWLTKRIECDNSKGNKITSSDITYGESESEIKVSVNEKNKNWSWSIVKTALGVKGNSTSELAELNMFADVLRESHQKLKQWPVLVYYSVNRAVKDVKPIPPAKYRTNSLEVYEDAFGGKTNFQSFFEWFRQQDDIKNERATTRQKWVASHKQWLSDKIHVIFIGIEACLTKASEQSEVNIDELLQLLNNNRNDEIIFEDPRIFMRQLLHLFKILEMKLEIDNRYKSIHRNLDNMVKKLEVLVKKASSSNKQSYVVKSTVKDSFSFLKNIVQKNTDDSNLLCLYRELFSFAFLTNLWWMSSRSYKNLKELLDYNKTDPKKTFDCDDLDKLQKKALVIINDELKSETTVNTQADKVVQIVSSAIENFLPGFNSLRVKRMPKPAIVINKDDKTYDLAQLSDGEKNLIVMIGDIARRLTIANSTMQNPLCGRGVILIDEIDLHLHPRWQRLVIPRLIETFPNCQFFLSTHSPQAISHVKAENIFLLEQTEAGLIHRKPSESYGMSVDRILELVMDDESRPESVQKQLEKLFDLIERKKIVEAKKLLTDLKQNLKTDPDLIRAETLIRYRETAK